MLGCEKLNNKPLLYLLPDDDGSNGDSRNRRCRKQAVAPQAKLLTLPTVLTIGRVAAVPLLVCSEFFWLHFLYVYATCVFLFVLEFDISFLYD